jgi:hypothetical protein
VHFACVAGGNHASRNHREAAYQHYPEHRALTVAQVTTAETWARENVEAIAERRAWIKVNGTPLVDLQVLKAD